MQVRYVEYFPAELQALALTPRHEPAFRKAHVESSKALATYLVAAAAFARERVAERLDASSSLRVFEDADCTGCRINGRTGLCRSNLNGPAAQLPVCGPRSAVQYAQREAAGPASESRKLPAADQGVQGFTRIMPQRSSATEGQFHNPVGIDLM